MFKLLTFLMTLIRVGLSASAKNKLLAGLPITRNRTSSKAKVRPKADKQSGRSAEQADRPHVTRR